VIKGELARAPQRCSGGHRPRVKQARFQTFVHVSIFYQGAHDDLNSSKMPTAEELLEKHTAQGALVRTLKAEKGGGHPDVAAALEQLLRIKQEYKVWGTHSLTHSRVIASRANAVWSVVCVCVHGTDVPPSFLSPHRSRRTSLVNPFPALQSLQAVVSAHAGCWCLRTVVSVATRFDCPHSVCPCRHPAGPDCNTHSSPLDDQTCASHPAIQARRTRRRTPRRQHRLL
jgi:hypothetical protein